MTAIKYKGVRSEGECAICATVWPIVKGLSAKGLTDFGATVPYRGVAATKQETTGIEKQAPNFRRSISIPSHLCTCAAYVAITKSAHAAKISSLSSTCHELGVYIHH